MRNSIVFLLVCFIVTLSIFIGIKKKSLIQEQTKTGRTVTAHVPNIGSIEVLNGCGISGAASVVADFLRYKQFGVENIDNADSWNYPQTLVVSRTQDMTTAKLICEALQTENLILLRDGNDLYNVSIFVGSDFGDLIK